MSKMKAIESALESGRFNEEQKVAAVEEVQARLAAKVINPEVPMNAWGGAYHTVCNEVLWDLRWQCDANFLLLIDAIGVKLEGQCPRGVPVFIASVARQEPAVPAQSNDFGDWDDSEAYDYI